MDEVLSALASFIKALPSLLWGGVAVGVGIIGWKIYKTIKNLFEGKAKKRAEQNANAQNAPNQSQNVQSNIDNQSETMEDWIRKQ